MIIDKDLIDFFNTCKNLLQKLTIDEQKVIEILFLNNSDRQYKIKKIQQELNIKSKAKIYRVRDRALQKIKKNKLSFSIINNL